MRDWEVKKILCIFLYISQCEKILCVIKIIIYEIDLATNTHITPEPACDKTNGKIMVSTIRKKTPVSDRSIELMYWYFTK